MNTEKIKNIIDELKTLTLIESAELVSQIENTFKLQLIEMNVAPVSATLPNEKTTEKAPEKTIVDVILTEVPSEKKIAILKQIRNITGLGLKESKEIVDNVPKTIKEGLAKEDAETLKKDLESLGAKIILK